MKIGKSYLVFFTYLCFSVNCIGTKTTIVNEATSLKLPLEGLVVTSYDNEFTYTNSFTQVIKRKVEPVEQIQNSNVEDEPFSINNSGNVISNSTLIFDGSYEHIFYNNSDKLIAIDINPAKNETEFGIYEIGKNQKENYTIKSQIVDIFLNDSTYYAISFDCKIYSEIDIKKSVDNYFVLPSDNCLQVNFIDNDWVIYVEYNKRISRNKQSIILYSRQLNEKYEVFTSKYWNSDNLKLGIHISS